MKIKVSDLKKIIKEQLEQEQNLDELFGFGKKKKDKWADIEAGLGPDQTNKMASILSMIDNKIAEVGKLAKMGSPARTAKGKKAPDMPDELDQKMKTQKQKDLGQGKWFDPPEKKSDVPRPFEESLNETSFISIGDRLKNSNGRAVAHYFLTFLNDLKDEIQKLDQPISQGDVPVHSGRRGATTSTKPPMMGSLQESIQKEVEKQILGHLLAGSKND